MIFDDTLTLRAGALSLIYILETYIDVSKCLFAKVKMRLVNVYKRFGNDMFIDNQAVVKTMTIAATVELRI